jgi:hypothetical protein
MTRIGFWTTLIVAASGFGVLATAQDPPSSHPSRVDLAELAWLEGHWVGESDGVSTEEIWTSADGGIIVGLHRDVFPSGKAFFEFLLITATEEGIVYLASPMGRDPTSFALEKLDGQLAVFSNPEHDFPQRIIYRRDGDHLHARIEGEEQGQPRSAECVWQRTVEN